MMFEKAKPFNAQSGVQSGLRPGQERVASRPARRAGEALRALEWSELTARLNAARDLRLLLRTESHAPIEQTAASFGDAAASYFAMIDEHELPVNHDALDCSKASDGIGMPSVVAKNKVMAPPVSAQKPPTGLSLVIF